MANNEKSASQGSAKLQDVIDRSKQTASLHTPERVDKYLRGEMTLAELNGISGPEMLEMAVVAFQMYEQGKYEEAKVIFQGLASLEPREAYFATALGAVHLAQENLDDAERYFNVAITLNPQELSSYVNRGEVYLRKGKIIEAAEDFKKVLELDPEQKDPLTARARVLAMAAYETMKAAKEELDANGKIDFGNQPSSTEKKAPAKNTAKAPAKPPAKSAAKKK
ncbi:MAG: tetratricopeptide repeat protein [Myxococcaceae bacterium]